MYQHLGELSRYENIQLEPSALAGMPGPVWVTANQAYRQRLQLDEQK